MVLVANHGQKEQRWGHYARTKPAVLNRYPSMSCLTLVQQTSEITDGPKFMGEKEVGCVLPTSRHRVCFSRAGSLLLRKPQVTPVTFDDFPCLLGGAGPYGFRNLVLSIMPTLTRQMRSARNPNSSALTYPEVSSKHASMNALRLQSRHSFNNQEIRVPAETQATKSKHNGDYRRKYPRGHGEPVFLPVVKL